jgi:hypothetical protein
MNILMQDTHYNNRNSAVREESDVSYILVTRFNMYLKSYVGDASDETLHEWSLRRLDLFRHFCLGSVQKQTKAVPFRWIIMADAEDSRILKILRQEVSHLPHASVYPSKREIDPYDNLREAVRFACIGMTTKKVATFRLDCDDAINRNFFQNCDLYLRYMTDDPNLPRFVLSFPFGLQITKESMFALNYASNPFVGLVESVDDKMVTVYRANHGYIFQLAPVIYMHTRYPMWVQVVHGGNVMNSIYRDSLKFITDQNDLIRMFGIDLSFPETHDTFKL